MLLERRHFWPPHAPTRRFNPALPHDDSPALQFCSTAAGT
jgi:hypothetical protein